MAVRWGHEVEDNQGMLRERNLGELLTESFAIYGKHIKRFLALVAIVQVPVGFLALITSGGSAAFVIGALITAFASMGSFGATVYAVGQHYATGEVAIGPCYQRVWSRIVSLAVISAIFTAFLAVGLLLAVLVVPLIGMLVIMVYWAVAPQAIVMEGYKPVAALRRSYQLVQGNWLRVLGISTVVVLVLIGLGLVLAAPFAVVSSVVASEDATLLSQTFQFLSRLIVAVAVPPLAAIASTLIYYDLRVRKENYDLTILSREMGRDVN